MTVRTRFLTAILSLILISPSLAPAQEREVYDPFETINRGIFWFNDQFDIYLAEPVAKAYQDHLPIPVQRGVTNFFRNLRYPYFLLADLVVLDFNDAALHTGRFLLNSTVGLLGLIDVAKEIGWEHKKNDFGLALSYYGVPGGPYLVLPILGPSNLRDTLGLAVDTAVHPFSIWSYSSADQGIVDRVTYSGRALEYIMTRAEVIDAVDAAKSSALDYYLFMQSAYYQRRRGELYRINPPPAREGDGPDPNSLDDDLDLESEPVAEGQTEQ